jgi:hypothetical protein
VAVKAMVAQDKVAKQNWDSSTDGQIGCQLITADVAYPIITGNVWKVIERQSLDVGRVIVFLTPTAWHALLRQKRNTILRGAGIMLPGYKSLHGTSKCKILHSILPAIAMSSGFSNISTAHCPL